MFISRSGRHGERRKPCAGTRQKMMIQCFCKTSDSATGPRLRSRRSANAEGMRAKLQSLRIFWRPVKIRSWAWKILQTSSWSWIFWSIDRFKIFEAHKFNASRYLDSVNEQSCFKCRCDYWASYPLFINKYDASMMVWFREIPNNCDCKRISNRSCCFLF